MISDNCALLFKGRGFISSFLGCEALCIWGGREDSIREDLLSEGQWWLLNYQTFNDKVVCQKGNSPEQVFKVPKFLLSESKEVFKRYNQEIGLEAAIF